MSDGEKACFNCETGKLRLGACGWYCFECQTYLPDSEANKLAEKMFAYRDELTNLEDDLKSYLPPDLLEYAKRKQATLIGRIIGIEVALWIREQDTIESIEDDHDIHKFS